MAQSQNSGTLTTLYDFEQTSPDVHGYNPLGPLTLGDDGNLYGTTGAGGPSGGGTVFQITPAGVLTTLHSFAGLQDGASPRNALVKYTDGSFYGTAWGGGGQTPQTAFRIAPDGTFTSFGILPMQGGNPNSLVLGSDGNFYGTTVGGGADPSGGSGTFFQLTPDGVMTWLHTFGTSAFPKEGIGPSALVAGPDGNFYGTTRSASPHGSGTSVFQITPAGDVTILASLPASAKNPDGSATSVSATVFPLVLGIDGNFYGLSDGFQLFSVTPTGVVSVLASGFFGILGGMMQAADGSFYISLYGVDTNGSSSIVKVTSGGAVTTVYKFQASAPTNGGALLNAPQGVGPSTLVQGPDAFYGTTQAGGPVTPTFHPSTGGNSGTVFKLAVGVAGSAPVSVNPESLGNPSDSPGSCNCGDPISLGNGNLFEQVADYQTSGPNKLRFTRYYNSLAASNTFATTLGMNWRSSFDRYLRIVSASSVTAERPDGQQVTFTLTNGAWTANTDVDLKLTNSGSAWTLTDTDDNVETYSVTAGASEALLQTIRARNGFAQTLQYGSGNQLSTVTDSFNRRLSFAYSSGKLQTVTTPDALILTYGYTGAQLTSVGYSTSPPTSQTYLYENTALPSALTGIVDENGNRYATWTYDSTGRALSSQHAGGAGLIKISYNDTDGSRTITNPLGQQEVWKFSTLQGVPKTTEVDRLASASLPAATRKFTYDSNGYTASQTDWNGNLTSYVNDLHGQPTTVNEAVGTPQARTTTVTYLSNYHLPSQIVTPGLTTTFTYDASGQLLTKKLADTTTTAVPYSTSGQTRTWTYTWSNFLLASVQTPRTDVTGLTKFTYDSSGALTATANALGQTTRIAQHLPGGLPQTIVDPNGVTANLTYDPRQRVLSSTVAAAAGSLTTSYRYDPAGNRINVTLPDGAMLTNTYDAAHRLTGVTDLFNQSIAYTLDAQGDPTNSNVTDAGANPQRMRSGKFDALGRLQQDIGGVGQTTSYAYDSNSNLLTIADPLSHTTQRAFDALNRLIAVTDPTGGVTTASYDAHDRPISVTDPNGGVTTYVYDGFGDVIQRVSPDSGTRVYHYDLDGNPVQRVDGTGAVTNHTYDALDRVKTAAYPADAAENVAYTYDQGAFGIGRLTALTDAAGALTRSYDERGNVVKETRANGGAKLATTYTYDAANRVASITYPSGWTVAYTRDIMGRPAAVAAQSPGGGAAVPVLASAGYQPFGPINALLFGNGVAETRGFDLDYRLTGLADTGTVALQNLTYTYDAANNVSSISDAVTAGNSQTFAYDALDRLTSAAGGYGSFGYTYDAAGNRLSESVGDSATAYAYTAHSNQLAGLTAGGMTQTIGYDKAGNVNNFSPAAGAITAAVYNQAGRLAAVMAGSNSLTQYTYDAVGQRLLKLGAVSGSTLYQYDRGGHLLEETDGQGNAQVDYIFLDNLPVATLSPSTGQVYFLHDDRLGTPQAATDSNQNIVWTASYGPFGEMSTVPSLIVQNLRLPGQEFDIETGLYHNGFRDYVPGWGRYLQSDPIGLAGGLNTYGYVGANPVSLVDPLGLVNVNFIAPDDPAFWPNENYNPSDYFTISAHGSATDWNNVYPFGGNDSKGNPIDASPLPVQAVGDRILAENWDRKKPIRALICNGLVGGDNSFDVKLAQYLANQIQAPVTIEGVYGKVFAERFHVAGTHFYWGGADPGTEGWISRTIPPSQTKP